MIIIFTLKSSCLRVGIDRAGEEERESTDARILSILSTLGVAGVPSLDLHRSGCLFANLFAISIKTIN